MVSEQIRGVGGRFWVGGVGVGQWGPVSCQYGRARLLVLPEGEGHLPGRRDLGTGGRLARAWISLTVNTTFTNRTLRLTILTAIRYALLDPRK